MQRGVFLDRDGTINIEKNYLFKADEFEFEPGAVQAISMLNRANYKVFVVTNQAGVARGFYSEVDVLKLHRWINKQLKKHGAMIDKFYYCPHHPVSGFGKYRKICECRKPRIALIEQAIKDFKIDRRNSFFIGDRESDIQAGLAAGLKPILVLSGYGNKYYSIFRNNPNVSITLNLYSAVKEIILINGKYD